MSKISFFVSMTVLGSAAFTASLVACNLTSGDLDGTPVSYRCIIPSDCGTGSTCE